MDFSAWRRNLQEAIRDLVRVANGSLKATLLIRKVNLVNVNVGMLEEDIDIAVYRDRIAAIGENLDYTAGEGTIVIDGKGMYAAPGFIDAHIHIESSMLTPARFAEVVLPLGTTTVFADPHEIANVLGVKGIELFIREARRLPLKVYFLAPSCVPATRAGLETSGQTIGKEEILTLYEDPAVVGLGEVMDFVAVVNADRNILDKISATISRGLIVEGHAPQLSERELNAYIAAGITSCHESTSKSEAFEKLKRGMYVYVREGSAWLDLNETIRVVTENRIDSRHVVLVTDDREPHTLISKGHINHVVKKAISSGVDPITAIQMVSINVAEHFEMSRSLGSIAPGRSADILLFTRLTDDRPRIVIADGVIVAKDGKLLVNIRRARYPVWAKRTIRYRRRIRAEDLVVKVDRAVKKARVRVIKVRGGLVTTSEEVAELEVVDGRLSVPSDQDIAYAAVIERHKRTGRIGRGFVTGFGLSRGAIASSISHDSHNVVVVGKNLEDMAVAANRIADMGGGIVAASNGKIDGEVQLPIAGLVSDMPAETIARNVKKVLDAWRSYGCQLPYPFMTMSLLSLTVIPDLRLTDKGLVNVREQRIVSVIVD